MSERPNDEESLARLLGELEELERTRAALLQRIEVVRSLLLAAANPTGTIRASAELLCDHISHSETAAEELSLLAREMHDVEHDVDPLCTAAARPPFEAA